MFTTHMPSRPTGLTQSYVRQKRSLKCCHLSHTDLYHVKCTISTMSTYIDHVKGTISTMSTYIDKFTPTSKRSQNTTLYYLYSKDNPKHCNQYVSQHT